MRPGLLGTVVALALPLLLQPAPAALAAKEADLARRAQALEAEIGMAGTQKIYFVLRGRESTLLVKAAGLTLRTIPITHLSYWGDDLAVRPRTLVRKTALQNPRRPTIRPTAKKADEDAQAEEPSKPAQELDVLELRHMPVRFQMELDERIRITVRPEPETLLPRLREWTHYLAWLATRPFPTLWRRAHGAPYTALYLRVASADAQALYWACADGSDLLLLR